jgi:hypothetical protein
MPRLVEKPIGDYPHESDELKSGLENTTATVSRWPCAQGGGAFVALR